MLFEILKIVGAVIALLNVIAVFCAVKGAGAADKRAEELLEIALRTEPMDAEWGDEADG